MRITERETSSKARWSLRLAIFTAQLIIVTVLLHRFATLSTPAATNLIVVSLIGASAAIFLAILAFAQIWSKGIKGTGIAVTGLLISLMIYAVPLYHLPNLIRLPAINDVTTDLLSPPQFQKIASLRDTSANSVNYPGTLFISQQARSYPDIGTLMLERSNRDSYDLVHGVIQDLGWEIVGEQQPGKNIPIGYIEAVDQSQLVGFTDDIVVRIRGDRSTTRIDMRSASRYGRHDLGANANRIREVFSVVKTRIARAEANRIDAIARQRIAKRNLVEKKKKERERKLRAKQKNLDEDLTILPKARFDQVGSDPANNGQFGGEQSPNGLKRKRTPAANSNNPFAFFKTTKKRTIKADKRRAQKIRRSKRKRKRKDWIPFGEH